MEENNFEKSMENLENLVTELEKGELNLDESVKKFEEGIDLGDFTSMPAKLEIIGDCEAKVIVQEGKFHQVKRMFEAVGVTVVYLKRLSMGSLKLDETLAPGESRALTQEELECLKES